MSEFVQRYPLPHTGNRIQISDYLAVITFPTWHLIAIEVKDGNPTPIPPFSPDTYTLRASDLKFHYFVKNASAERLVKSLTENLDA